jgi:hypothetical protein
MKGTIYGNTLPRGMQVKKSLGTADLYFKNSKYICEI